jgi:GDP/UDP-N,N'-diacetylbacillosamine 2-epimerase (hydrolysing)
MKRKICVVTGSRADYGLIRSVMKKIDDEPSLTLQIIVTGMHLSREFGNTYEEIEKDGFAISSKIECLNSSDSPKSIADSIGRTLKGCAEAFEELKPDVVLILGDRFEIFAAATAALITRIPIAHIHGGEKTLGAYDEAFRHSITKMANLHFVATKEYKKRVIQLGEKPEYIFEVGGVGIDDIKELQLLDRFQLESELGIRLEKRSLLVTFHPATLEQESSSKQFNELLNALSELENTTLIFTMPNADTGGRAIIHQIRKFVEQRKSAYAFESLGRNLYLSCLANVNGVIGNSSSGILEAPSFKIGTINIGNRQEGRVQASSVINTNANQQDIAFSLKQLFSKEFQSIVETTRNPYGEGGASMKIVNALRDVSLDRVIKKEFLDHDLSDFSRGEI